MTYSARKLITNSYYLTGIVGRLLQSPTGDQISDGLELLNFLLADRSADTRLNPFFKEYDFPAVSGQEKYSIPNLLEIDTLTFNIGSVRYAMINTNRTRYFGASRVDAISSLPFNWHAERVKGGTDLYLYFSPNSNYPLKIWGKFGLDSVDYDTDLSLAYELNYINYLRYALADYICEDYNLTLSPQSAQKLREMEAKLADMSARDYTMKKISSFQRKRGLDYGAANLGVGYYP
jgi:hypothetical protein